MKENFTVANVRVTDKKVTESGLPLWAAFVCRKKRGQKEALPRQVAWGCILLKGFLFDQVLCFFLNSPTFLLFILCFSGFFLLSSWKAWGCILWSAIYGYFSSQVLAQEINPHLGRRFADRKRSFCETVGSACQHDTQITGWSVCFFASLLFASLLFALCFVYFLPSLCIGMYGSHFDWMISSEPISFQQKAN